MSERQQDLGKGSFETPSERLQSGEFFPRLSLPDIYGRYIHPAGTRFPISWNTYRSLTYAGKAEVAATKQAVIEQLGIPSIAGWGTEGSDRCVVLAGPTEPLGFWVPQQAERRLLTGLASRLAGGKDRPLVLEIEAGTGIIGKILAAESPVRVIAIEQDGTRLSSLPPTNGDVTLQRGTAWDVLQKFGAKYPDRLRDEVAGYLDTLQRYQQAVAPIPRDISHEERTALTRMRYLAKGAMKRMQQLAPQYIKESPVDMVIQSVGERLSSPLAAVAIRDGIQPRIIVSIRQVPGLQPIPDDWREKYNQSEIGRNKFDMFDPGENYRTVAAWRTFSEKYWGSHMYDLTPHMQTEVLLQLRKDIHVRDLHGGESPQYPFDNEVLEVLGKYGKAEEFQAGITAAREQLLAA